MTETAKPAVTITRVSWDDPRAVALRDAMDAEIQPRYAGRETDLSAVQAALRVDPQDIAATILLVAADGTPVAHAALRRLGEDWEVKRVVVAADQRGRGLALMLMIELEAIAEELGAPRLILQTGDRQPEAVALYRGLGYREIPIYEPYVQAIPFSLCFEKVLAPVRDPR